MNEYTQFALMSFAVLILAAILVFVFIPQEKIIPYVEAKPGCIFSTRLATTTPINTGFLITVTEKSKDTERITPVYESQTTQDKSSTKVYKQETEKEKKITKLREKTQTKPTKTMVKEEELDPYTLEGIIKSSERTYFFNKKKQVIDKVLVELLSITPHKGSSVLKLRITNDTDKYFIWQSVGIIGQDVKIFLRQVVNAHESITGYLVFPETKTEQTFVLTESGGGYRKFRIAF